MWEGFKVKKNQPPTSEKKEDFFYLFFFFQLGFRPRNFSFENKSLYANLKNVN